MVELLIGPQTNKEKILENKSYKLADATIAQIVQLIQMGILTGTDISDQMRTLRVVISKDGQVEPDPDFLATFSENLENLEREADDESK